jgi:hypothetical protein
MLSAVGKGEVNTHKKGRRGQLEVDRTHYKFSQEVKTLE